MTHPSTHNSIYLYYLKTETLSYLILRSQWHLKHPECAIDDETHQLYRKVNSEQLPSGLSSPLLDQENKDQGEDLERKKGCGQQRACLSTGSSHAWSPRDQHHQQHTLLAHSNNAARIPVSPAWVARHLLDKGKPHEDTTCLQ